MQLISKQDDTGVSNLIHRMESENGLVEIGVFEDGKVNRVRAGFVGIPESRIDWHCGTNPRHMWSMYAAIYLLMRRRPENEFCFDGIPEASKIEPYYKDDEFGQKITDVMLSTKKPIEAEN